MTDLNSNADAVDAVLRDYEALTNCLGCRHQNVTLDAHTCMEVLRRGVTIVSVTERLAARVAEQVTALDALQSQLAAAKAEVERWKNQTDALLKEHDTALQQLAAARKALDDSKRMGNGPTLREALDGFCAYVEREHPVTHAARNAEGGR